MVTASPEIARRAGRAFWIRKWRTGFGVFSLGAIACVIATIIWMVALFGPARAPLAHRGSLDHDFDLSRTMAGQADTCTSLAVRRGLGRSLPSASSGYWVIGAT